MMGDVEKMVAVGLVWGATNALMRRGALIWDQSMKSLSSSSSPPNPQKILLHHKLFTCLKSWFRLLLIWQYSVPFLLNLSASATFFAILGHTPISLAVPITNATTFAATALFGILLGEETRLGLSLLGAQYFQWKEGQCKLEMTGSKSGGIDSGAACWIKLPQGYFKLNVDVAIFSNANKIGFGMIMRNAYGCFVAALVVVGLNLRWRRQWELGKLTVGSRVNIYTML